MLRNREVAMFLLLFSSIFVVSIAVALFTNISTVVLVGSVGFFYIILYIPFTRKRYRSIQQLAEYVRDISSGNYNLDVRDNVEGELSILKNEIYKVTNKLSEQSSALENDKIHLVDSISDISHQLKTPLTSMTMMADFLASPDLPEEKRVEFSAVLLRQLERIDWLVSSLLKLSKIDAGSVQFDNEQMTVTDFVDYVLERIQTQGRMKRPSILVDGKEDALLSCDKNWTAEAFINIINNCVEHSPTEEPVNISWKTNTLYTEIIVQDRGPGISMEERGQIFNRFFKGKHASEDSVGIGLAMAYSIITNQQGTIEVDSVLEEGTTFKVTLYHPHKK